MNLPNSKLKQMADYQRRLDYKKRAAIQERVSRAMAESKRLAREFLNLDPELEKVILFGSLARGVIHSEDFDIDLAVLCSREKYLSLVVAALNSSFHVDLADLRSTDERIRASIDREGRVIFDRGRNLNEG
jgi:predicted nucleotidyltransferase